MYIGINVRSFIMVAFQLILIIQVVSVLQVKFDYLYLYTSSTIKQVELVYKYR